MSKKKNINIQITVNLNEKIISNAIICLPCFSVFEGLVIFKQNKKRLKDYIFKCISLSS